MWERGELARSRQTEPTTTHHPTPQPPKNLTASVATLKAELNATAALHKLAVLKTNASMLGAKPNVTTALATLAAMKNITSGASLRRVLLVG